MSARAGGVLGTCDQLVFLRNRALAAERGRLHVRYLYLANDWLGREVLRFLVAQECPPVGLVVHPPRRGAYQADMVALARLPPNRVFDGSSLREAQTVAAIEALGCELALSVLFEYILRPDFLRLFPRGCLNLHPGFLPHNRGSNPSTWSIIEGTPPGAAIHFMDEGIDTGDLVARRQVAARPTDTGATLYRRIQKAGLILFRDTWPAIRSGNPTQRPQMLENGAYHRAKDLAAVEHIDLDRTYSARVLIDLLRACTSSSRPGAYFVRDGRRVFLRLRLIPERPPNRRR
jgi:methionyl-tRNA formyltransferase